MTKNQIAERIAYALNEPLNVPLKENIKFSINNWRATLIRRDVQANGMSDGFLQRFYVDLQKVDKADACNFNLNCVEILRTKNPIPRPVRLKSDTLFKFVGTVDGKSFSQVEYEEVPYTCYKRFTSKDIKFCYVNEYIYIFNNTKLKKIAFQYIVADPSSINNSCTDDTCLNDDSEYPLPEDMVPQIIAAILSGEFKITNPVNEEVSINKTNQETQGA